MQMLNTTTEQSPVINLCVNLQITQAKSGDTNN